MWKSGRPIPILKLDRRSSAPFCLDVFVPGSRESQNDIGQKNLFPFSQPAEEMETEKASYKLTENRPLYTLQKAASIVNNFPQL
jgi:hypothetical protein